MVTEVKLFESLDLTPLHFSLWGWTKNEVYKSKVDTRDESLARILYAATRINERENELRPPARDLGTGAAKCIQIQIIVNCNQHIISVQQICHVNIKLKSTQN